MALLFKAARQRGARPGPNVPAGGTLFIPPDVAGEVQGEGEFDWRFGPTFVNSQIFSPDEPVRVNGQFQLFRAFPFVADWTPAFWGIIKADWPANRFGPGERFAIKANINETDSSGNVVGTFATGSVNIEITGAAGGADLVADPRDLVPDFFFTACFQTTELQWWVSNTGDETGYARLFVQGGGIPALGCSDRTMTIPPGSRRLATMGFEPDFCGIPCPPDRIILGLATELWEVDGPGFSSNKVRFMANELFEIELVR